MKVHLVSVEVCVVGRAHALVEPERPPLQDLRLVTHDGDPNEARQFCQMMVLIPFWKLFKRTGNEGRKKIREN